MSIEQTELNRGQRTIATADLNVRRKQLAAEQADFDVKQAKLNGDNDEIVKTQHAIAKAALYFAETKLDVTKQELTVEKATVAVTTAQQSVEQAQTMGDRHY